MSPGQTGHITGQMGRVPGTDGTHTKGCPAKILYVYWFFLSLSFGSNQKTHKKIPPEKFSTDTLPAPPEPPHSCTRVRGPPVVLHVSRYTRRSRFPQNPGDFQV